MLQGIRDSVIRDTVAAVFRDPAYNRETLLSRIGAWLREILEALFSRFNPRELSQPMFWMMWGFLGLLLLGIVARVFYRFAASARLPQSRRLRRLNGGSAGADVWRLAMQHAESGDYTSAAHTLYAALLALIAAETDVELHESKTIGDYLRDLSRHSHSRLSRFREFARTYETVIYGLGFCDRARFERLLQLAQQMAGTRG